MAVNPDKLEAVKRVHDAAVWLGAHCDPSNCFFQPYNYNYKSHDRLELQSKALTILSTLN